MSSGGAPLEVPSPGADRHVPEPWLERGEPKLCRCTSTFLLSIDTIRLRV